MVPVPWPSLVAPHAAEFDLDCVTGRSGKSSPRMPATCFRLWYMYSSFPAVLFVSLFRFAVCMLLYALKLRSHAADDAGIFKIRDATTDSTRLEQTPVHQTCG